MLSAMFLLLIYCTLLFLYVQIQICNSFDSEELKHIVSSMHDTWLKLTFQQVGVGIDFIQCISVSIYTYICMTFGHVNLIVEAVFHK